MEQMMNQDMNAGMVTNANMSTAKKEGKGMLIGMICCALLAVGGIGFGVYEMTQANSAKQQISDLKVEVKNADGSTTTLETDKIEVKEDDKTITIADTPVSFYNPIISNGETRKIVTSTPNGTDIFIEDGQVSRCAQPGATDLCEVTGLSGKSIYKVVAVTVGQALTEEDIFAFIMEDGSVEYAFVEDFINSNKTKITIVGTLKTDKPVRDILALNSCGDVGCGSEAAIIFSDGTYQIYNKSMLN